MSLRRLLNKNPRAATMISLLFVIVAAALVFRAVRSGSRQPRPSLDRAFFTVDDGRTFFVGDSTRIPPFITDEGKEAVRAMVFSCKEGADPFTMYMVRYTPEVKKELEGKIRTGRDWTLQVSLAAAPGMQVKRPGDARWVGMNDQMEYAATRKLLCPDGSKDGIQAVAP